jgi:hypothetical protein
MSVRLLAKDLYRLVKEVEKLEKQIMEAKLEQKAALNDQLRKLKAERNRLRSALEGRKESGQQPP